MAETIAAKVDGSASVITTALCSGRTKAARLRKLIGLRRSKMGFAFVETLLKYGHCHSRTGRGKCIKGQRGMLQHYRLMHLGLIGV